MDTVMLDLYAFEELSDDEMLLIDGDGWGSALIGAAGGISTGAGAGALLGPKGAVVGGVVGGVLGFWYGW